MSATLRVMHRAIGAEARRGAYDVVLDGERVGSVEMNDAFEQQVEPGRHSLYVRSGRNSSRSKEFDAADGEVVAFRCSGKGRVPIPGVGAVAFLLSIAFPSLALSLRRE